MLQHLLVLGVTGMRRIASTCVRVGANRASEEQNEWFGVVNAVVNPSTRLLDSEVSPLVLT
jgi:hypothetical protein